MAQAPSSIQVTVSSAGDGCPDRQRAGFDVEQVFVELVLLLYGGPAADKLTRRQAGGRKVKAFDVPEPR